MAPGEAHIPSARIPLQVQGPQLPRLKHFPFPALCRMPRVALGEESDEMNSHYTVGSRGALGSLLPRVGQLLPF